MQNKIPRVTTEHSVKNAIAQKPPQTTSWNAVSDWYNDYLSGSDTYQATVIAPNILRMLDLKQTDSVLDLACGQGYFSELFAKTGAAVVGIDSSEKLIAIAASKGMAGKFFVASAHETKQKPNSFDSIVCILALENIKNIDPVFAEASRVLKQTGRMLLVLLHPAFRIPQHSDWAYDTKKQIQYRRIDKYLSEISIEIEQNPHKNSYAKKIANKLGKSTITFHRSLQLYMKIFRKNGFAISAMEEWISNKKSQDGPKKEMEDKARKEFPMFLALELRKV